MGRQKSKILMLVNLFFYKNNQSIWHYPRCKKAVLSQGEPCYAAL